MKAEIEQLTKERDEAREWARDWFEMEKIHGCHYDDWVERIIEKLPWLKEIEGENNQGRD